MTDHELPAGLTRDQAQAVREWAERSYAAKVQDETMYHAARVLLAVLPKRPTLADMTDEERRECRWMQADVANHSVRYVITNPCDDDDEAELIAADGKIEWILPEYVTPRPDLPRMEWPADQKVEDVTPVKVGDVIESADPRVAALPDGSILIDRDNDAVIKWDGAWSGAGYIPRGYQGDEFGPWTVARLPKKPAPDRTGGRRCH